jgi:hypothetical protein
MWSSSQFCIIILVVVVFVGAVLAGVVEDFDDPLSSSPPTASTALQVGNYGDLLSMRVVFGLATLCSLLMMASVIDGPWDVVMIAFSAMSATALLVLDNVLAPFALDAVKTRFQIRFAVYLLTVMFLTDWACLAGPILGLLRTCSRCFCVLCRCRSRWAS